MQRCVGSPGSGSNGIPEEHQGISLQEALVMLSVKTKEANEMQQRCGELEKMLEEKDEEILELMQDYNRIQERSEQKALP